MTRGQKRMAGAVTVAVLAVALPAYWLMAELSNRYAANQYDNPDRFRGFGFTFTSLQLEGIIVAVWVLSILIAVPGVVRWTGNFLGASPQSREPGWGPYVSFALVAANLALYLWATTLLTPAQGGIDMQVVDHFENGLFDALMFGSMILLLVMLLAWGLPRLNRLLQEDEPDGDGLQDDADSHCPV